MDRSGIYKLTNRGVVNYHQRSSKEGSRLKGMMTLTLQTPLHFCTAFVAHRKANPPQARVVVSGIWGGRAHARSWCKKKNTRLGRLGKEPLLAV